MANTTTSPNMNLPVPVPTVDPGPDYAFNLVLCLNAIDSHDHTSGSGVQIPVSGLNINTDLPLGSNNLTMARSVRFTAQSSPLALVTDLGCLYESGVDLYYNDGNGNQVRITQSGGVSGTPGSIANLTSPASASYVSANQTFVWQSAAATPANMDAASYIFRNLSANSKGLTLNPPAAMGSDFSLTLPNIPGATSFLQMDASGNFGTAVAVTGGITGTNIAAATITGANIAAATIAGSNLVNSTVTTSKIVSDPVFQGTKMGSAGSGNFLEAINNTYRVGNNNARTLAVGYNGNGLGYRVLAGEIINGTVANGEGLACVKNSTGNYTVTPTIAATSGVIYATVTLRTNGTGYVVVNSASSSTVPVLTFSSSNVATDFNFYIIMVLAG